MIRTIFIITIKMNECVSLYTTNRPLKQLRQQLLQSSNGAKGFDCIIFADVRKVMKEPVKVMSYMTPERPWRGRGHLQTEDFVCCLYQTDRLLNSMKSPRIRHITYLRDRFWYNISLAWLCNCKSPSCIK